MLTPLTERIGHCVPERQNEPESAVGIKHGRLLVGYCRYTTCSLTMQKSNILVIIEANANRKSISSSLSDCRVNANMQITQPSVQLRVFTEVFISAITHNCSLAALDAIHLF